MDSSSETVVRSSASDRLLVIMAKAPRPGAVKTRLAPSLSLDAVFAFYCCLLDDTLALAHSLGDVEVAIMCPESDVNELSQFAGNKARVVAQKGEGLAAGLTSVFAHFTEDHPRRIIAFNSDSPHLPRSVLEDAFEMLAAHDVVVDRRTTEVTTSLEQKLLILRFSHAMEWAPAARWRHCYRGHELSSFR